MKRRLFNLFVAVSLVLCIAFLSLFIHSYWWRTGLHWRSGSLNSYPLGGPQPGTLTEYHIDSNRGVLRLFSEAREFNQHNLNAFGSSFFASHHQAEPESVPASGTTMLPPNKVVQNADGINAGPFGVGMVRLSNLPRFAGYDVHVQRYLRLPHWFAVLLFAILPAIWLRALLRSRRRRRRLEMGECVNCGYDLRASQNKCPECGTTIPSNAPQSGATA